MPKPRTRASSLTTAYRCTASERCCKTSQRWPTTVTHTQLKPEAKIILTTRPTPLQVKAFELLGLNPEAGANSVIRKYREATQFVEVGDAGILLDVDDPETYRNLAAGN